MSTVSTDIKMQIFWDVTLRYYNPLKNWELHAQQHSVTSWKTCIFSDTTVRTANILITRHIDNESGRVAANNSAPNNVTGYLIVSVRFA
jgi:hypothetical protein